MRIRPFGRIVEIPARLNRSSREEAPVSGFHVAVRWPSARGCSAARTGRRDVAAGFDARHAIIKVDLQLRLIGRRHHAMDPGRAIPARQSQHPLGILPRQIELSIVDS